MSKRQCAIPRHFFSLRLCCGLQTVCWLYRFQSSRSNCTQNILEQMLFSSEPIFFCSAVTCGRSEALAHPTPHPRHTPGRQPGVLLGGLPHQRPADVAQPSGGGGSGARCSSENCGVLGLEDPHRLTPPILHFPDEQAESRGGVICGRHRREMTGQKQSQR